MNKLFLGQRNFCVIVYNGGYICHYAFVKTLGKYNTNREPQCKLWSLGGNNVLCRLIDYNKWSTLV